MVRSAATPRVSNHVAVQYAISNRRYFGFGIKAFSFSMSLTFILMPPGITMSPGFWSGLQAPNHFASIVIVESRGTLAGPPSLCDDDRGEVVGGLQTRPE